MQWLGANSTTVLPSGTSLNFPGTLSIAANKTLTASNTLTLVGTDASTITLGAGGTVVYTTTTQTLTNKNIQPRVALPADATSITPNSDSADYSYQANTQGTGTLTINADAGSAGQWPAVDPETEVNERPERSRGASSAERVSGRNGGTADDIDGWDEGRLLLVHLRRHQREVALCRHCRGVLT